jgi:hypothetical protein
VVDGALMEVQGSLGLHVADVISPLAQATQHTHDRFHGIRWTPWRQAHRTRNRSATTYDDADAHPSTCGHGPEKQPVHDPQL